MVGSLLCSILSPSFPLFHPCSFSQRRTWPCPYANFAPSTTLASRCRTQSVHRVLADSPRAGRQSGLYWLGGQRLHINGYLTAHVHGPLQGVSGCHNGERADWDFYTTEGVGPRGQSRARRDRGGDTCSPAEGAWCLLGQGPQSSEGHDLDGLVTTA